MRHKEIITILILVALAFLLVGVLQYFHLYEGLESGTIPPPKDTEEPPKEEKKEDKATITKYEF
jgi:hypothetical protein